MSESSSRPEAALALRKKGSIFYVSLQQRIVQSISSCLAIIHPSSSRALIRGWRVPSPMGLISTAVEGEMIVVAKHCAVLSELTSAYTNEYHDRNAQYFRIQEDMGLRKVNIYEFSRLNLVYTLLSKRKLLWFVENGKVDVWDDAHIPFCAIWEASKTLNLKEWDKLWNINKKIIDPVCPRYTAIIDEGRVLLTLKDVPEPPFVPDAKAIAEKKPPNVEVTLMDWVNAIVEEIKKDSDGNVTELSGKLHLEGYVKATQLKLMWLPEINELTHLTLVKFGYLITKKKVRCDVPFITPSKPIALYAIPDGKQTAPPKQNPILISVDDCKVHSLLWTISTSNSDCSSCCDNDFKRVHTDVSWTPRLSNLVIFVLIILDIVVYKLRKLHEKSMPFSSEHPCRRYSLAEIQLATNNFDPETIIGKGGFEVLCGRPAVDPNLDERGLTRPKDRPTMSEVVVDLEAALALQERGEYLVRSRYNNGEQISSSSYSKTGKIMMLSRTLRKILREKTPVRPDVKDGSSHGKKKNNKDGYPKKLYRAKVERVSKKLKFVVYS
ncbi:glutamate--tRNA ligase, cytoplasmic [Tanacetum coccineum]